MKADPRAITVILYKFGGFYLDLDYVVFNDLTQFHNIVVGNRGYVLSDLPAPNLKPIEINRYYYYTLGITKVLESYYLLIHITNQTITKKHDKKSKFETVLYFHT